MPFAPLRPCSKPGCPDLVPRGRCLNHQREHEAQRGTAHERGYDSRWREARIAFLAANPLCVRCKDAGRVTAARVVDHIVPHKGDEELFWDQSNWQALCDHTSPWDCHGKKTATEDGGFGRPRWRGEGVRSRPMRPFDNPRARHGGEPTPHYASDGTQKHPGEECTPGVCWTDEPERSLQ